MRPSYATGERASLEASWQNAHMFCGKTRVSWHHIAEFLLVDGLCCGCSIRITTFHRGAAAIDERCNALECCIPQACVPCLVPSQRRLDVFRQVSASPCVRSLPWVVQQCSQLKPQEWCSSLCCTLMCFSALPRAHTTGKVSAVFFTKTSEERQAGCSPLHWEVEARVPVMTMKEHPPRIGHRRQLVYLAEKLTPCPDPWCWRRCIAPGKPRRIMQLKNCQKQGYGLSRKR